MSSLLLVEQDAAVLTLTLNRPESKNALNPEIVRELNAELQRASRDPAVRAVVLTGAGASFCSGADLKAAIGSSDDQRVNMEAFNGVIREITSSPKPFVAAVRGPAVGFGMSLALACDVVLLGQSGYFSQKFVKIGLMPDGGSSWLLPQMIGLSRALELIFTGADVSSERALALGLCSRVVPDDELGAAAMELGRTLSHGPPLAYAAIKRVVRRGLSGTLDSVLDLERDEQLRLLASSDVIEGVSSWAMKRAPEFRGA